MKIFSIILMSILTSSCSFSQAETPYNCYIMYGPLGEIHGKLRNKFLCIREDIDVKLEKEKVY
jgi:hypothetical protein